MPANPSVLNPLQGRVVHLLARLTDDMFEWLGPATSALSRSSVEQAIVVVDHPRSRPLLTRLHDSIELVLVAPQRDLRLQWRGLHGAFARTIDERTPQALHLHGLTARLIGEHVRSRLAQHVPVFYSPHGFWSLRAMNAADTLLHAVARPLLRTFSPSHFGTTSLDMNPPTRPGQSQVTPVATPVTDVFFDVVGLRARHPLIVAASRTHDVRAVEAFDQLAVLLGGDALRMAFNWFGPVDPVSLARLKAANVGVFESLRDEERASRLASGWLFVAPGRGRGFAIALAEAMAAGLPCVAFDTPSHRDLVRHGETGYLCRSQAEIIDRIAQLVDTESLRERMGQAARAVAQECFSEETFRASLFAAYDLGEPEAEHDTATPRPVDMSTLQEIR